MSYLTDRKRVSGLGVAHNGAQHWISQRLTSIALIPLSLMFLFPFLRVLGADHAEVLKLYAHPYHAIVAVTFFIVLCRHLQQGLQVVIEDYVHAPRLLMGGLIVNRLFWGATAVVAVFSIAKIAFSA